MHVWVFIYTNLLYTLHTHILCKHKLLFWMRLIVAQHYSKMLIHTVLKHL